MRYGRFRRHTDGPAPITSSGPLSREVGDFAKTIEPLLDDTYEHFNELKLLSRRRVINVWEVVPQVLGVGLERLDRVGQIAHRQLRCRLDQPLVIVSCQRGVFEATSTRLKIETAPKGRLTSTYWSWMPGHFLPLAAFAGLAFLAGLVAAVFFGIARVPSKSFVATRTESTNRRFGSGEWYVALDMG